MSKEWNYVATTQKATTVTQSCVGNFTGPDVHNLIIGKCTHIEVHALSENGLQSIADVPIYGRIASLQLFRPKGESQDSLFITTERYQFCVLQWDANTSKIVTQAMGDISDPIGRPTDNGQIVIIDPDRRLIGLHFYDRLFKVIPFDEQGTLTDAFNIVLEDHQVLDIKFLDGCEMPTIVVLYLDNKDARCIKTYEVALEDKCFVEGPWPQNNLDNGADLLIPVPPPLCGVLIIGEESIVYYNANAALKTIQIPSTPSITKAYGRIDGSRYFLGDHTGLLSLLVIVHDNSKEVTGLEIDPLGKTSIASTISYLDNAFFYIGSSYGDSQLLKLNQEPDSEGSYLEVFESYVNLGPIYDFCVVDSERQGQDQVVTCSGAYKDGSLRVFRSNGIGFNKQASVELEGIKGMWSLRSSIEDAFDTFLVATFIGETRILRMNHENDLEEAEIKGFSCQVQTFFCHEAVHNQLVQVTSNSVRLVNSKTGELLTEWQAPSGDYSVNVATANSTQVLLAIGGGLLVYLEIGDGVLEERKQAQLEHEISCLDISPISENSNRSFLAAVGTWSDITVRLFSLPDLKFITKEHLGEIISRSVLLCALEGICYLLCALGDGHLIHFMLNTSTNELTDRKKVCLGTQAITLQAYSSENVTRVFAASDFPAVIYSDNKTILHSNVYLKEVSHMCPFHTADFPNSLAIGNECGLAVGTIDDYSRNQIRSIPLDGKYARQICHQEQTRTFAICSLNCNPTSAEESEEHSICLLDEDTFECISVYPLHNHECACSIISCSFSDDKNVYFCVGTGYVFPGEDVSTKGRILVFSYEERKLQLIAEKETKGAVYCLNAFNGKLLAAINQKIQLYRWVPLEDENHELQSECGHHGNILALYVQTIGDLIVVGDLMKSISLLEYMPEEGAIMERARDYNANRMSAVEILDNSTYLGAENSFNLFTVQRHGESATNVEQGRLEVVGGYHLGELVNRFRHGSLVKRLPDSDMYKIPTVIFGTINGAIGVIASLPSEQYVFLEKLQLSLRKVIKGVGGLSHEQWRSVNNWKKTVKARNFLDGDLIESFLDLNVSKMDEISKEMDVSVEELSKRVKELTMLH